MRHSPSPWVVVLTAAILLLVHAAGCGVEDVPAPQALLVSLSVTPANTSIAPGTAVQFTAMGTFSNGGKGRMTSSVTWSSSNTGIATISNAQGSKGLATAAPTAGATTITITATFGGISGSTTLTTSPVNSIAVIPNTISIAPGTTQQFTANGTLSDGTPQNLTTFATWASSNEAVATISDTLGLQGLATAVVAGSTSITAAFGGVTSGRATLTCSNVASIAVTPTAPSIAKGTTQQFTAIGTLSDGNTQNLTTWAAWESLDTNVATISSRGLAMALAEGTTNITAAFDDVTSFPAATLTVTPAVLQSIAVTPVNPSIPLGKTQQFKATGTFSDFTTQDITSSVTWNSSNTGVATISNTSGSNGLATSKGTGSTTIRATQGGISSSTTLTISPAVLESIKVTPANFCIVLGVQQQQFTATGTFSDVSSEIITASVTWNSSIIDIATISNLQGSQGLATAGFTAGSTTITATSGDISGSTTLNVASFCQ